MTGGDTPDDDFGAVMARYSRSCDEMRTVHLNPSKAIPVDQWPEEAQLRGSTIVRAQDWKRYARYVLRVAADNERLAEQARRWWAWWELAQVEPSKAGPAPLVDPLIESALLVVSTRRRHESARGLAGTEGEKKKKKPKRRRAGGTRRGNDLDVKACAAADSLEEREVDWRPADIAKVLQLKSVKSLTGTKPGPGGGGKVDRCPKFKARWNDKARGTRLRAAGRQCSEQH